MLVDIDNMEMCNGTIKPQKDSTKKVVPNLAEVAQHQLVHLKLSFHV